MKRAAIFNYIKPVISCCKINDVAINTTKVRKFMPPNIKVKKSREYKDYEIQKLLDIADERLRAAILILASTGIRIGALVGLRVGNLEKAGEKGELYKVTVYENEPEEYITFCTSECKEKGIDPYLAMRKRYGEVVNDSSPLIREQFDKRDQFSAAHPRQVKVIAIAGKIATLAESAGLRTRLERTKGKTGNRKNVPNCNGFRRFFSTQLVNSDVKTELRWLMEGHNLKANDSSGLFERIEKDPHSKYKKLFLGYELGLGTIYDPEYIEQKKLEPEFEREYNLKYLGKVGNVFSPSQIDKAIELGEQYKGLPINPYSIHSIGVDIGFGSSSTAVVATEFLPEQGLIRVVYAEEWQHGDPQSIVNLIFKHYLQYGTENTFIWVDGSNRAFCNLLKVAFNESLDWDKDSISPESMKVLPVSFAAEHKQMLSHLAMLVSKSYLAIPKEFDKLIISLRTAYSTELSLDKERTSYSDSLDALRLACKMYKMN